MALFTKEFPELRCVRILMQDDKLGMRAISDAIGFGDSVIPLIKQESDDFDDLNIRNAFWVAEVLGSIQTELAHVTLHELFESEDTLRRITGVVGLAMQKRLPTAPNLYAWLVDLIRSDRYGEEAELAITALGYLKSTAAVHDLIACLRDHPRNYWHHASACEALARLRLSEGKDVLRECFQDDKFHALPAAFRALITLGDKDAVPLAITRITPEIKGKNSGFVVKELERVTGQHFGDSREKWQKWWREVGGQWVIPPAFRVAWDDQPQTY